MTIRDRIEEIESEFSKYPNEVKIKYLNGTSEKISINDAIRKYGNEMFMASYIESSIEKPDETTSIEFMMLK